MIAKFGQVMVYVNDPKLVANFWVEKLNFLELNVNFHEDKIISVEVSPSLNSDTTLVLFDKEIVKLMSPLVPLETPSILFSSYDIIKMRDELISLGVVVGDIFEMPQMKSFNFADPENNYFAVKEIK